MDLIEIIDSFLSISQCREMMIQVKGQKDIPHIWHQRRTFYLLFGLEFCFYLICSMLSQTKSLFFTTTYFPCKLLGKSLSLPNTIFKTLMNYSQGLKRGNPLFLDEEKYQVIQHIISQKQQVLQLSLEKYTLVIQHSISRLNTIQCIFRK